MGEEEFKARDEKSYFETMPPQVPVCFSFLFDVFLSLRSTAESGITYTEIKSYCELMDTKLSKYDICLIFKMNGWANEVINEIREDY